MAIKVFDGFDHYNSATDFYARSGFLQWQLVKHFNSLATNAASIAMQTGRNGLGKCIAITGQNGTGTGTIFAVTGIFADRNVECFMGFAMKNIAPWGMWAFLLDSVSNLPQLSIHFNESNYSIVAYRGDGLNGGTQIGLSANNAWTNDVWQFIELHPKIDGTTGSLEVRVNNEAKLTLTGLNTKATANTWVDAIQFMDSPYDSGFTAATNCIDDFYYNDTTTGSGLVPANTYLGDSSTVTLFPIGNDSVAFTPLANLNWQEVSEVVMDSDTSYNYSSNVGDEDRFNFAAITMALDTAYAVQVTGAYRKDDGGTRTIEQAVKSGATESYSSGHNIPDTTYSYFTDLWVLNPATSLNWTKTEINALKGAYKLTA